MNRPPIKKVELHSVRLDSDIWAALKEHPQSLNQILRALLFDDTQPVRSEPRKRSKETNGNFQCEHCPSELQSLSQLDDHLFSVHGLMVRASELTAKARKPDTRPLKSPLLKPSEKIQSRQGGDVGA